MIIDSNVDEVPGRHGLIMDLHAGQGVNLSIVTEGAIQASVWVPKENLHEVIECLQEMQRELA